MEHENNNLSVVDLTSRELTSDDIGNLRELAKFWSAGKLIVTVVLFVGALATATLAIWSLLAKDIK